MDEYFMHYRIPFGYQIESSYCPYKERIKDSKLEAGENSIKNRARSKLGSRNKIITNRVWKNNSHRYKNDRT